MFERAFERTRHNYETTLDWALNHRRIMVTLLIATIALNFYLYYVIPKGFFPQQDTGQLQGGIRGDASASFQLMKGKLQQVAAIIQADPAVATVTGSYGAGGFGPGGGGGANELQRDIIAMAGLFMPRAPRDLRANQNGDNK